MLDLHSKANTKRLGIWVSCALLLACTDPPGSPEEAVRAWVTEAVAAAENKDRRELLTLISHNYLDARGNERDDVGNLLRVYFFRQQKVAIMTKVQKITMLGDTAAEVSLTAGMAGTNDSALGLSADAYQFEFDLENDGDAWLLLGARWGGLGEELR
jgi:hypothetical protein